MKRSLIFVAIIAGYAQGASATLLDFETVAGSLTTPYQGYIFAPNGHTAWSNLGSATGHAAHSGLYGAVNQSSSYSITAVDGGDFTFDGLWANAWNTAATGSVVGYKDGSIVWSVALDVSWATGGYEYAAGQAGVVDEIKINSSVGQMAIDDLTLSSVISVPEPETYALFAAGLGLMAARRRNRK